MKTLPASETKSTQDPSSPPSVTPEPLKAYAARFIPGEQWYVNIVSESALVAIACGSTREKAEANAARIVAGQDLYEAANPFSTLADDDRLLNLEDSERMWEIHATAKELHALRSACRKYRGDK